MIDYVIGSPQLLAQANKFEILVFDRLFSDVHAPVRVALRGKQLNTCHSNRTSAALSTGTPCNATHSFRIVWDSEKENAFVNSVDRERVSNIMTHVNQDCDVN